MPFGPNCEYKDFAECVRKNQDKDNPEAYCGTIQRETEGKCDMARIDELLAEGRQLRARRRPAARTQSESWYRIENKKAKRAKVFIYDEISFWGISAQSFINELEEITADEIELHLNSPGGDVFDGFAIYQALLSHKATVEVQIDSLAASIASVIAMAGDIRQISTVGQMMIHDAFGFAIGNAEDMRKTADLLDRLSDTIAEVYAARAGHTRDYWRGLMKEESWFNAEEAKAAGLVSSIYGEAADDDSDKEPVENRWDLSIFTHAGREEAPAPQLDRPVAVVTTVEPSEAEVDEWEFGDGVLEGAATVLQDALAEPFEFDPDVLREAVRERATNAPAPPTVRPRYDSPTDDPLDNIGTILREALLQ